jgi:hypothetical protein
MYSGLVISSHSLTILSGSPDRLVVHVCGVGHYGGVEHQVDVVVIVVFVRLEDDVSSPIPLGSKFTRK